MSLTFRQMVLVSCAFGTGMGLGGGIRSALPYAMGAWGPLLSAQVRPALSTLKVPPPPALPLRLGSQGHTGAESPELRALRSAELELFANLAQSHGWDRSEENPRTRGRTARYEPDAQEDEEEETRPRKRKKGRSRKTAGTWFSEDELQADRRVGIFRGARRDPTLEEPVSRTEYDPDTAPGGRSSEGFLAGLSMPEIPIKEDPRVERYVHYFSQSTEGRKIFRAWLKRSGRYRDMVATQLREQGLPTDLHALAFMESGYSPTAVSSAGAVGMWQFMPQTARIYGLRVEEDYDERRSVQKSTRAALSHLADLYEKFGTWDLAFAAYDMGYAGLVDRIRQKATNDYWTLAYTEGVLPHEVVLYVPKVQAVALILRNLERFGFDDTVLDPPDNTADLEVPPGTQLATVARASGTSLRRIRNLNPELLRLMVPERGDRFLVHIPPSGLARARSMLPRLLDAEERDGYEQGVGADFDWGRDELPNRTRKNRLEDLPRGRMRRPHGADEVSSYRVGEEDTVASIARAFGVDPKEIVEDNRLDPTAKLQPGMSLRLRTPERNAAPKAKKHAHAAEGRPSDDREVALAEDGSPPEARNHKPHKTEKR